MFQCIPLFFFWREKKLILLKYLGTFLWFYFCLFVFYLFCISTTFIFAKFFFPPHFTYTRISTPLLTKTSISTLMPFTYASNYLLFTTIFPFYFHLHPNKKRINFYFLLSHRKLHFNFPAFPTSFLYFWTFIYLVLIFQLGAMLFLKIFWKWRLRKELGLNFSSENSRKCTLFKRIISNEVPNIYVVIQFKFIFFVSTWEV